MPEGFLGKLQIRKSGKVELKMGDIVMDVSEGAAFSFLQVRKRNQQNTLLCLSVIVRLCVIFLQELVSVRHSEGKSGDMMVLGNVHHKLVLSPDFQSLLTQAASQQKKEPWHKQTASAQGPQRMSACSQGDCVFLFLLGWSFLRQLLPYLFNICHTCMSCESTARSFPVAGREKKFQPWTDILTDSRDLHHVTVT